ncbi:hypothetical protein GL305_23160 [Nocardia seriolae]|uniref:hypothetical protein n=1 Tax=Nocardia seriolae TaxID=37332 RepID=UPI0012BD2536|nr:hypothetical protein [Nocardia seriolae]MTK32762.1 hypothetical protein [Nocardia seriolae]
MLGQCRFAESGRAEHHAESGAVGAQQFGDPSFDAWAVALGENIGGHGVGTAAREFDADVDVVEIGPVRFEVEGSGTADAIEGREQVLTVSASGAEQDVSGGEGQPVRNALAGLVDGVFGGLPDESGRGDGRPVCEQQHTGPQRVLGREIVQPGGVQPGEAGRGDRPFPGLLQPRQP